MMFFFFSFIGLNTNVLSFWNRLETQKRPCECICHFTCLKWYSLATVNFEGDRECVTHFNFLIVSHRTALARFRQAQLEEGKVRVRIWIYKIENVSKAIYLWIFGRIGGGHKVQIVDPNSLFGTFQERRPFLASECNELPKAEKWRRQVRTFTFLNRDSILSEGIFWSYVNKGPILTTWVC